ncbi:MAG: pyridoxamine 5'-phosphate oxidase family protein [Thermoprotei archaeon]
MKVDLNEKWVSELLSENRVLRIATVGADGQPHVSSAWFIFKDHKFLISTASDRLKAKDVAANPKVALIVDTDTMPYKGVIVWGTARLLKEGVLEATEEITARYVPSEHVKEQVAELMRADRVLIEVTPLKVMDIMSYRENNPPPRR